MPRLTVLVFVLPVIAAVLLDVGMLVSQRVVPSSCWSPSGRMPGIAELVVREPVTVVTRRVAAGGRTTPIIRRTSGILLPNYFRE